MYNLEFILVIFALHSPNYYNRHKILRWSYSKQFQILPGLLWVPGKVFWVPGKLEGSEAGRECVILLAKLGFILRVFFY
jgi:hypothetical protein